MKNQKDYTTKEIIEITISNLGNISVPVNLVEQIGIPLAQNINNLKIALGKMQEEPEITGIDIGEIEAVETEAEAGDKVEEEDEADA